MIKSVVLVTMSCMLSIGAGVALADTPPSSNGVISNPTLVANSSVAKAQAVGAITAFMSEGAKKCDDQGQNCHSLFGEDDTPDYNGLQQQSQALSGVQSFGFMEPDGDSSSIAAQTGTLAIACGNEKVQQVAGVALKVSECLVNANGDARVKFKVCTAPSRNLPVTQPDNAVECSRDPTAPNFTAPAGKVCKVAACDTEAVGSLNGWSTDYTAAWTANLPADATSDQKAKNGLAMVFYPALNGSVTPDFKADSDNMTAVKVVQSFINNDTGRTAVGMRVAYRHKTTVTKAMMEAGTSSVPNPEDHTQQWETLRKLQANALVPQYAAKYGRNGADCIQQINNGIGETGTIYVCDQTYSNESGIKPLAKSASIAVEGEDCGTTAVCVQKVVNTNTWQQTCQADVPLSMRTCTTTTDYTTTDITSTRTKPTEICTEKRTSAVNSCNTSAKGQAELRQSCVPGQMYSAGGVYNDYAGDVVQVAYVCNSTELEGPIPIRLYAHGTRYRCGDNGYKTLNVDFTKTVDWTTGPNLSPDWNSYCNDVRTQYRVTEACTANDPDSCRFEAIFRNYRDQQNCTWNGGSIKCTTTEVVVASWSFALVFKHPSYIVPSYEVDNQCGVYEAAQ